MISGTLSVLRRRLANVFDEARIRELVDELIRMGLLRQHTLGVSVTADAAEQTAALISPYGSRFASYLSD